MKDFLKMLAAVIVGTALVIFVAGVLLIGVVTSLASMGLGTRTTPTSVAQHTVLVMGFENGIATQDSDKPLTGYAPDFLKITKGGTGLLSLVRAIEFAATDPAITMIYLRPQYLNAQITHIEEIRNALQVFRQSGKPIICYADTYTQAAYYLATVADKVILNPLGNMQLQGLSLDVLYYKDLFDKVGIQAQVIRHGSYKSGGENYVLSQMSPQERSQTADMLQSTWQYVAGQIAAARHLDIPDVEAACARLLLTPAEAHKGGFVDEIWYKDQLLDYMCNLCDVKNEKQIRSVSLDDYAAIASLKTIHRSKNKIALVYATGEIRLGSGQNGIWSEDLSRQLRLYGQDSTIKAVVLRVDSPGGDPLAAEVIRRDLEQLAHRKPLVVTFGDLAASGGYWIASPARVILTHPQTIAGSIGVYSLFFSGEQALRRTLHVTPENVSTHPNSQFPSYFRALTADQQARMQQQVDSTYQYFLEIVSRGRHLTLARTDSLAQGHTWSGIQALELQLADRTGGLTDALAQAASLANLTDYQLIEYPQPLSFLQTLLSTGLQDALYQSNISELMNILESRQGLRADVPYRFEL